MSRRRTLMTVTLVAAMSLLSLSAGGASPALAACAHPLEKVSCLFTELTEKLNTAFNFKVVKNIGAVKIEVVGGETIQCAEGPSNAGESILAAQGSGVQLEKLLLELNTCIVVGQETKCEVKEPIVITATGQFFIPKEIMLVEKGVGPLAEVTIKAKVGQVCIFAAEKVHLAGSQTCETGPNIEIEGKKDHLNCEPAGSKLKFAGKETKLTLLEFIELETGGVEVKEWSLQK
jgi:hypothetical protein